MVFITGTDTGVGKTLLTALLLAHLRSQGRNALALKPFCSGTRADAELLHSLQDGELTLEEINPFYFSEPIAPLIAARNQRRKIFLAQVVAAIRRAVSRHTASFKNQKSKIKNPLLLLEGSGGLLVPLGKGYTVLDLIKALRPQVLVVAHNRLGTINHTVLTVRELRRAGLRRISVVLMNQRKPDFSARSNHSILAELLAPIPVHNLPFLGAKCDAAATIRKIAANRCRRQLARIAAH